MKYLLILSFVIALNSCGDNKQNSINELESKMNIIAEDYVKLVLDIGKYKTDYVDAYYGPEEWKPDNSDDQLDSTVVILLEKRVDRLLDKLENLRNYQATELERMRFRFLYKQLLSVKGVIYILSGGSFPFDIETKRIYDAEAPHFTVEHFNKILDELNKLVPGEGNLSERLNKFTEQFFIPDDKLDTVFSAAINECRKRTMQYIELPLNENFKVEFVSGKSWGAYNWYKGNSFSLIQVNTDIPVIIDRAIDLAAHEGYPGHHVFNALLEKNFSVDRGWVEFSVYPLYSPLSLLAEGTANYGIDVAFPENERTNFEREVLFPLAGLNPEKADLYYKILGLLKDLKFAGNEAARNYLDGNWTAEETIDYLQNYLLFTKDRATKRLDFIKQYRSYVINYNLGEDMVKDYVERKVGTSDDPVRRWEVFTELLNIPQTPSGLLPADMK